jgi:hypothetical protein
MTASWQWRFHIGLSNSLLQSHSNVDQLILQLSVDELEGSSCGAQSEDLRMLRGRRIVRVQYLRGCQT